MTYQNMELQDVTNGRLDGEPGGQRTLGVPGIVGRSDGRAPDCPGLRQLAAGIPIGESASR